MQPDLSLDETVLTLVRREDDARFLAIQRAAFALRPALYAITAFHAELARIASLVSEPLMGHIRLAWWREALQEIAAGGAPRGHPVLQALVPLRQAHPAALATLLPVMDARAADLDASLVAQDAAWEQYRDATAGAHHVAWAQVLDPALAQEHAQAILAHARAHAMLERVRHLPKHGADGGRGMPSSRLASLAPSATLNDAVRPWVEEAAELMVRNALPERLKPLLALTSLNQFYARELANVGYDPYRFAPSRMRSVWQVVRAGR